MEIQYSKQDKAIEEGATVLREMSIDTSKMSSVLNPRPHRSIALPVGLATVAACALGAVLLLTPAKATANPFQKVKEAVLLQKVVHERAFQRGKDGVWELRVETYKDDKQKGVKWGKTEGGYQYVITDGKKVEKWPDAIEIKISDLAEVQLDTPGEKAAITEILAQEGMKFLGIKRSQKRDGRACDIYRVNFNDEPTDTLYYVDPKTDLPFLQEVVDKNGKVLDKIEIDFTAKFFVVEDVDGKSVSFTVKPDKNSTDLFKVEGDVELQVNGKEGSVEFSLGKITTDQKTKKDK